MIPLNMKVSHINHILLTHRHRQERGRSRYLKGTIICGEPGSIKDQ